MSHKPRLSRTFPPDFPLSTIATTAARMQNSTQLGNLITSAVETVVDKAKRRSRGCVVFFVSGDIPRWAVTTKRTSAEFVIHPSTTIEIHLTSRCAVE